MEDYFDVMIELLKNRATKDGWVTIYKIFGKDRNPHGILHAALVKKRNHQKYLKNTWSEVEFDFGKPEYGYGYENGKIKHFYNRYSKKGFEPIAYRRSFTNKESSFEFTDELKLCFNLYERIIDSQNRELIYTNGNGRDEVVGIISSSECKIKLKVLKNYLSLKRMVCFIYLNFDWFNKESLEELNEIDTDEDYFHEYYSYNIFKRNQEYYDCKTQFWIIGKTVIYENEKFEIQNFDYLDDYSGKYEKFIIGYSDETGEELYAYSNDDAYKYRPVYFKKDVLSKYYENPSRYKVDDGWIMSDYWSIKVDNNNRDYIITFLKDLKGLHYLEQLHWKQFNYASKEKFSYTASKRWLNGEYCEPEVPDLFFKMKYEEFNEAWANKYGFTLFKKLDISDNHNFESLHLLTDGNNAKEFDDQILSLVKIIVDSINEKEISQYIKIDSEDKGITKLEKYIKYLGFRYDEMFIFIRNLQKLRSTSVAHRRSSTKNKKLYEYFQLHKKNVGDVFEDILMKTIGILLAFERDLL